jgi:hypothetical protein
MKRPYYPSVAHIEGMDLAGKSTAVAHLATAAGGCVHHNSLLDTNPIYELADELRRTSGATASALGPLYLSALTYDLDNISDVASPGVQDSTILLRSVAYNEVLGARDVVRGLKAELPRHPRFGHSVVLTASIDARRHRLDERRAVAPEEVASDDLLIESAPEMFCEMERALVDYSRAHFDGVVLDTTELSKDEVRLAVSSMIGWRL